MKLKTKHFALLALLALCVMGLWMWFGASTFAHGRTVIGNSGLKALDPANDGINIVVAAPWLNDSILVFNVGKPSKKRDFDRIDATRCLLQCAKSLDDRPYKRMYLANKWNRMYYIEGHDLKALANKYRNGNTWGNALLYMELPGVVHTLNDSLAFQSGDGLLRTLTDMDNWNTMMGNLMRD